jgi:Predicted transcriptional regulators
MYKKFGQNLVKYRKLNGLSQKYTAKILGISVQGLWKIEKGATSPSGETLAKIVDVLGITPNQLFGIESITEENSNILRKIKPFQSKE